MANFKKNKLWYIILSLFIINWLCYFFHSTIGIGVVQSFIIDIIILVLIFTLLFVNRFKVSIYMYVSAILILIIIFNKNYYLYQYFNNFLL